MKTQLALGLSLLSTLALVGCSGADARDSASSNADESALRARGARIDVTGNWHLQRVAFASEGSSTISDEVQSETDVTFAFRGPLPTRADVDTDDGLFFVPMIVTFHAPEIAGGGKRRIEGNAYCMSTLLFDRPDWQVGVECKFVNEKDQRSDSWIASVTYATDGSLSAVELKAQHRPNFDQMIVFTRQ